MSVPLALAVVVVVGSLVLLALMLRRPGPDLPRRVCAGTAMLCVGFALLVSSLIPDGVVHTVASLLFTGTAVWFLVLEWRLGRRR